MIAFPYRAQLLETAPGLRSRIITAGLVAVAFALMLVPPLQQDQAFHAFAETNRLFGIPNFGDVISNAAYVVVGVAGLLYVLLSPAERTLRQSPLRLPLTVYLVGVMLIGVGSAYYHWAPSDATLLWDRLAMALVFAALFAVFVTDRVHPTIGATVVLPLAVAIGAASMLIWAETGDLRLYRFVQIGAIGGVLMTCLLFDGRRTSFRTAAAMAFWFGAATLCEAFDHEIHLVLGQAISGHTIKHVLSAVATWMVVPMLIRSRSTA